MRHIFIEIHNDLASLPVPALIPDFLSVAVLSGTRHQDVQQMRRSRTLDLAPGCGCQKGRTGHVALPGFVVDGFEQAAVEGDVDPPR